MLLGKEGQESAGSAATLVAIITGFILLFILFLPPDVREDLLGLNKTDGNGNDNGDVVDEDEIILVKEFPGELLAQKEDEFKHEFPSVTLFAQEEDTVLKSMKSITIESGTSVRKSKKILLVLASPATTQNVVLSFNVVSHKGRLEVLVNDEEIYSDEPEADFVQIPITDLEEENIIELRAATAPMFMFWQSNSYQLRNVQITGTLKDVASMRAVSSTFIDKEETENMEKAELKYFVQCVQSSAGRLTVFLNSNRLFSAVPQCNEFNEIRVDPRDLDVGRNDLEFQADKGRFQIDTISLNIRLDEPIFPVFFFELNETSFKNITRNKKDLFLKIRFVDDDKRKAAILNINNHRTEFDTREASYERNIDVWAERGNNFVRVEPRTTLRIIDLVVKLVDRN